MGDLQKKIERKRRAEERYKTARKTRHTDNPGKKKRKRSSDGGWGLAGNFLVDHICVSSSVGL